MADVLELLAEGAFSIATLFAFLHWDESRLTPRQRDQAWPTASRRIAVVYFGVLSLPVHFVRTRRSVSGLLQGVAWTVAFIALDEAVGLGVEKVVRHALSP
jgi:hypothetical protein